ncbi:hypothetical protein J2X06_002242 [Lysobacter niastensis]|uniref:Uncharacterized protein n=1 Tax=Lysobacter niastensis TaxID=380629 RepID=A0ABU1WBQ8_9GAMM|nr:hypothetical protein [Lysobacter niastensis]MDR7135033.1 hypothetical protein [Lysobacter niastensis]
MYKLRAETSQADTLRRKFHAEGHIEHTGVLAPELISDLYPDMRNIAVGVATSWGEQIAGRVEHAHQADYLRDNGVRYGQG